MTTWASRMGITRSIEGSIRTFSGKTPDGKLNGVEKVLASCGGGVLSCWNQPFEVSKWPHGHTVVLAAACSTAEQV